MKLLRRGAAARRKTADVGPVGPGTARWRPVAAPPFSPPRVSTVTGAAGVTWSPLDYLRSRTSYKLYLLAMAGNLFICVVLAVTLNSSTSTAGWSSDPPAFADHLVQTPSPEKEDPNNTLPGGHRVITRQQWGGRPARSHPTDQDPHTLAHPIPYVTVSHTASAPCFHVAECSRRCRGIQDEHMGGQLELPDIAANFLVGGDGNLYVGRGWDVPNTHTGLGVSQRRNSVDVSFIGNFESDEPTKGQLNVALELFHLGVELGKLTQDYKLFSLNDTDSSSSPGTNMYIHIKDWPHFTLRADDAST